MKKVFLIRNVAPEKFGGGEIYQITLALKLKANGLEPVIVTNSEKLLDLAKRNKIRIIIPPYNHQQNWSGFRNLLLPVYYIWQKKLYSFYKKLFQEEKPSAINIQSRDEWIAATLAAKDLGITIYWTDHADFRNWVLWNTDKKFKNTIGKTIVELIMAPRKIILISKHDEIWLKNLLKEKMPNNLMVIQNGVLDQYEKNQSNKTVPQSFCYIGRIEKDKGINELITAFDKIQKKYPEAKLNLFGDGPDLETYKKSTKDIKNITFHGYTNEPLKALSESEVFVLPSYKEGLSLSLLDAAMMGKSIIATNVGGTSEVVIDQKTGILIPPKNTKALEEAMLKLLKDSSLRKTLAKNARCHYKENFDFEEIFEEKILPLYMKPNPLISIIIPVYNVEPYLKDCLDSVINQTYKNLEIILVNDGSTDNSKNICEEYKKKDSRIILINQKNSGLSSARNAGTKQSTGEYISFIDSDDYVEKDYIEELYNVLFKNDSDISVCGYNKTVPIKNMLSGKEATVHLLTKQENIDIVAWNKLYRKTLFIDYKITFPEGEIHEDTLTTYKLYSKAKSISYVAKSLYYYRERQGSITKNNGTFERLKKREQAATEAVDYLNDYKELKEAAEISLLLSYFAYLDNYLAKKITTPTFDTIRKKILSEKKRYLNNKYISEKLKLYLSLLEHMQGLPYKLFRKIKHE